VLAGWLAGWLDRGEGTQLAVMLCRFSVLIGMALTGFSLRWVSGFVLGSLGRDCIVSLVRVWRQGACALNVGCEGVTLLSREEENGS
jgi:hypothetical protein